MMFVADGLTDQYSLGEQTLAPQCHKALWVNLFVTMAAISSTIF